MKKRIPILLSVCLLAACSFAEAAPEVKAFLTGLSGSEAYAAVSTVAITEIYRSLNGTDQELGRLTSTYEIDKSDAENLYWHRINLYEGDQISGGIVKAEYLLCLSDGSYHSYVVTHGEEEKRQDIALSEDKAFELVRDVIYTPQESYDAGGLYYGDIFKINVNIFPQDAFILSPDGSALTFACDYETSMTNDSGAADLLLISQDIAINQRGLIISSSELIRVNSSKEAGENTLTPVYGADIERLASI